ncbi:uncharacterized protein LOC132548875 [Ylistrum balloti]|uniref:uncharacterized protein LOC132548875 n=1 Tax=Ylistrum balloti TaxID=509963 RepID=UPI00290585F3|nr:uncharacterized protein LOC132548875 [Ylistrum balloti]
MYFSDRRSVLPVTGTAAENETAYSMRVQALAKLARLSYAMITSGMLNIVAGIVILVSLNGSHMEFPLTSGAPIWSGVYMAVLGVVGITISQTSVNLKHDINRELKCRIGLFYGLSTGALSACGLSAGYTGGGITICAGEECAKNGSSIILIISSISIAISTVMFAFAVCGMVFFFRYRNFFQMYSSAYRNTLLQRKLENLESRVNQASEGQSYGGIQSGKTGQENGGYPTWNTPPPPAYSEKA